MSKLLPALFLGSLIGLFLAVGIAVAGSDVLKSPERIHAEIVAQERAATAKAEQDAQTRPFWYGVTVFGILLCTGVLLDAYGQRRRPVVRADARGLLPVDRRRLQNGAYDAVIHTSATGFHAAQIAAALPRPVQQLPALSVAQDAPQSLPAPALPDTAALADYLPRVTPGRLALGVMPGGALIEVPFMNCYHALLTGDTRSGKTNALDGAITHLHYMARRMPLTLYAGDYKRELESTWRRSPLFAEGIQTTPAAIADLLTELVEGSDGVQARYAAFAAYGEHTGRVIRNVSEYARARGEPPRMAVLVLDELNALLEAAKKDTTLASRLKQLLQIGAGAGIYVLGGAQYLSAATFGRDGSKQFVTRATFGAFDPVAAGMLFGRGVDDTARAYITGAPGRGLIRTAGQPQPTPFQALLCEEKDIIDAIALHAGGGSALVQSEPAPTPCIAVEPPRTSGTRVPDAAIIQRMHEAGLSQNQIIELAFGVKKGGSEAYRTAREQYRHIIGDAAAL